MSELFPELAYNVKGERYSLPGNAVEWKGSRIDGPGGPKLLYDPATGLPQRFPIDATAADIRNAVGPGTTKIRLDALDASGRTIDAPPAYIQFGEIRSESTVPTARDTRDDVLAQLLAAQAETMRAHTETIRTIANANVEMMRASAELLRAADGAGLPSRQPLPPEPVYVVEEEAKPMATTTAPPKSWVDLVMSVMEFVQDPKALDNLMTMAAMARGGGGSSRGGSPRPAETPRASSPRPAPTTPAPRRATYTPRSPTTVRASEAPSEREPTAPGAPSMTGIAATDVDTAARVELGAREDVHDAPAAAAALDLAPPPSALRALAHLKAIRAALTADEWEVCEATIKEMAPDDLIEWRDQILAMTVEDAVMTIRDAMKGGENL